MLSFLGNRISGGIPLSLPEHLIELDLGGNPLGPIDSDLRLPAALERLDFSATGLSGTFPLAVLPESLQVSKSWR